MSLAWIIRTVAIAVFIATAYVAIRLKIEEEDEIPWIYPEEREDEWDENQNH